MNKNRFVSKPLIFGSGLSSCKDYSGLFDVCSVAFINGIRIFDTAPSYQTEVLISKVINEIANVHGVDRRGYCIQTKIDPIQMYNGDVESYFENKLNTMNLEYIDSLLIHWPLFKYLERTWESMLRLKDRGLVSKIGICNLRLRHLVRLFNSGIIPDICQIERHPLNVFREETLFCVNNKIELQSYSPLCKMHSKIRENALIKNIAIKHNKSIGQIILRWHIDTGAIPIFTSTKLFRINEYSEIDDFVLSKDDIDVINSLNCNHKLYLESLLCPGF